MLNKIFFLLLISSQLFSQILLKEIYTLKSDKIYIKDILPDTSKNKLLFVIDRHKHSKRIKSSKLIELLENYNIKDIKSSSRYIKFKILSPINTIILETFIRQHYSQKYKNINIKNISVNSRGYVESLPDKYIIEIRDRSYLSRNGVFNIKDTQNKKIFFNYNIDATVKVLKTKEKIRRGEKLSFSNTRYVDIKLDKFRSLPVAKLLRDTYQTARQMKTDKVITIRDIQTLNLVHKNSQVSAGLYDSGIYITFSAKALQNGRLGDIITIQKSDLKRLKAKVIGKKKVEIQ